MPLNEIHFFPVVSQKKDSLHFDASGALPFEKPLPVNKLDLSMNFLMGQTYGLLFDLIKLDLNKRNKKKPCFFIS